MAVLALSLPAPLSLLLVPAGALADMPPATSASPSAAPSPSPSPGSQTTATATPTAAATPSPAATPSAAPTSPALRNRQAQSELIGDLTASEAHALMLEHSLNQSELGLMALGLLGPFAGLLILVPAATLIAAGVYQVTRPKEVCLTHCQSPMGFVMLHWHSGRTGAVRMGLRHAAYCLGCCWLFMIVLCVAGSMSLLWMGLLSGVIFVEKVATRQRVVARAVAALLLILGAIAIFQVYLGL